MYIDLYISKNVLWATRSTIMAFLLLHRLDHRGDEVVLVQPSISHARF